MIIMDSLCKLFNNFGELFGHFIETEVGQMDPVDRTFAVQIFNQFSSVDKGYAVFFGGCFWS